MPFNSDSYYRNKYLRSSRENIAKARDIKDRAAKGEAYEWDIPRIEPFVKLARIDRRLARSIGLRQKIGK